MISKNLIYGASIVWFLFLGILTPLTPIPTQAVILSDHVAVLFGAKPLITMVLMAIIAAVSGISMFILVLLGEHQPILYLQCIKLFVVGLPAGAVGTFVAMVLGWLGLGPYEAAMRGWPFLAASTVFYLCGGLGGIMAMNRIKAHKGAGS